MSGPKFDGTINLGSALNAVVLLGGLFWAVATFTSDRKADAAEITALKARVDILRTETNTAAARLAVLETDIRYIRASLDRIERVLSPRIP